MTMSFGWEFTLVSMGTRPSRPPTTSDFLSAVAKVSGALVKESCTLLLAGSNGGLGCAAVAKKKMGMHTTASFNSILFLKCAQSFKRFPFTLVGISSPVEEVLDIAVDCEGVVVPEVDVNKVGMCEITGGDLFS